MLLNFKYFRQLYFALGILVLIIFGGTIGYYFIEGYTVMEAFYMTVITVSTVGFSEVRQLSDAGRLFTSILIIVSFGTFAYAISNITRYLIDGEYRKYFRDYKVNKEIEKLKNHVIVCGYGRNGRNAVKTLLAYNEKVVVIENNEQIIDTLREKKLLYIMGDARSDETMIKAGIQTSKALITTLPNDADNVFVVLSARELNPNINIISRASDENSYHKLRIAGANNVIMPDLVGGDRMASLVVTPDLIEFLEQISILGKADVNLEEIHFDNIPDEFKNKKIKDLNTRYQTGVLIIGFKTPGGDYIINPSPEIELIPGSKLFVLGKAEQIRRLNEIFRIQHTPFSKEEDDD
ncbi:MAG: potassium channel protein [Bacteroidetes bacterium]|nr:MAG: potassium channel protein [Bacteroidota bacterium]